MGVLPLTIGIGAASAAGRSKAVHRKVARPRIVQLSCATNVGVMIASGDTSVAAPAPDGQEYGTTACGRPLGSGVQQDTFTLQDSGDTTASFKMYFPKGSIQGTYDLFPGEGSFGASNFSQQDSQGTLTVTGGTGRFRGTTGAGTLQCTSPDGVHTTCTDRMRLRTIR